MEEKTIIFRIMRPDKTFYPETVTFIPGTDLSDFRESGNQVRVHQKFFEGMCNPVTGPAEQNPFGIDTKDGEIYKNTGKNTKTVLITLQCIP